MSTEIKYIEGFNSGYLLAEHKSELLKNISKSIKPANEYLEGFLDGKEQKENERVKEQLYDLNELRENSQDKAKGLERE